MISIQVDRQLKMVIDQQNVDDNLSHFLGSLFASQSQQPVGPFAPLLSLDPAASAGAGHHLHQPVSQQPPLQPPLSVHAGQTVRCGLESPTGSQNKFWAPRLGLFWMQTRISPFHFPTVCHLAPTKESTVRVFFFNFCFLNGHQGPYL